MKVQSRLEISFAYDLGIGFVLNNPFVDQGDEKELWMGQFYDKHLDALFAIIMTGLTGKENWDSHWQR